MALSFCCMRPRMNSVLQPQALVSVRDVRELRADRTREHVFEQSHDLAQLARRGSASVRLAV